MPYARTRRPLVFGTTNPDNPTMPRHAVNADVPLRPLSACMRLRACVRARGESRVAVVCGVPFRCGGGRDGLRGRRPVGLSGQLG